MPSKQGDLALLDNPLAQELLHSTIPARLAYVWKDGTPRVIPICFHWNGNEIVAGSPITAPKVNVMSDQTKVALTIDSNMWPYRVLLVRGTAKVQIVDGVTREYAAAAERYLGAEQGRIWVEQIRAMCPQMARISIRPEWVGFLDFETRFPSAIERAMEEAAARPS